MRTIDAIADPVAIGVETNDMMKALVYGGAGQRTWQSKPKPVVRDPGDAVVRITTSTICGTDLHIQLHPAEFLDTKASASSRPRARVSTCRTGDRVLISCISACGM